jgi:hypothetical protein
MNGKRGFFYTLIPLLFAAAQALAAQENAPVLRRLSWRPVEYASGYEVVVEILTASNEWVEQFRKTGGTETFVDCPLFIGKYRFRVSALDLLGRPGSSTGLVYFELRAREPAPEAGPPESDAAAPRDAASDKGGGASVPGEEAERPESAAASPPESAAAETRESAAPPAASLPQEDEKSPFVLELFYTPLITLSFSDFNEIYTTDPFQPVGFALRFTAHPFAGSAWGLGLTPFWNFLATELYLKSRYTHITGVHLFAAWRQPVKRDMYINIRAGGGLTYISSRFDFNEGLDITTQAAWNPSASIGISFQGRLSGSLFLDAGIEYFHVFSQDNVTLNYLRPMIGIGWRF